MRAVAPAPRSAPVRRRAATARAAREASRARTVWIETESVDCVTAATELDVSSRVILPDGAAALASRVARAVAIDVAFRAPDGCVRDSVSGERLARVWHVASPEDAARAAAGVADGETSAVVMEALEDWSVIPAENLVAAFAGSGRELFAVARDAAEARVMFEALEVGVDGIVLRTDDPREVRAMKEVMRAVCGGDGRGSERVALSPARVTAIRRVGTGDRAAVDCCTNFEPGEGMLVGSFASGLFLVHAENIECGYVNSRPFRVNAGPTASYCKAPGGRTNYLSELRAGSEILVVGADGRARTTNVARVKIERRSLILIEAEHPSAGSLAVLLQNAETCRLVRPSGEPASVSELAPGDDVLVAVDARARHTGTAVDEAFWIER